MIVSNPVGHVIYGKGLPVDARGHMVSLNWRGQRADKNASSPALSSDGRFMAFSSKADNLEGRAEGHNHVYRRDNVTGDVVQITAGADGNSQAPSISRDGRFIAFDSNATNLAGPHSAGKQRVYLHDCQSGETKCLSGELGEQCFRSAMSADGSKVAFQSQLHMGQRDGDIFIHDVASGQTHRASLGTDGSPLQQGVSEPVLSADGRCLAFAALQPTKTDEGQLAIYLRDLSAGTTEVVASTAPGSRWSWASTPSLSADGRYVAFAGIEAGNRGIFVVDRALGQATGASHHFPDPIGNAAALSYAPSLSDDGRHVAFLAHRDGDVTLPFHCYVSDVRSGATARLGEPDSAYEPMAGPPRISPNGLFVAYPSGDLFNRDGTESGVQIMLAANTVSAESRQGAKEAAARLEELEAARQPQSGVVLEPDKVTIGGVTVPRRKAQ